MLPHAESWIPAPLLTLQFLALHGFALGLTKLFSQHEV